MCVLISWIRDLSVRQSLDVAQEAIELLNKQERGKGVLIAKLDNGGSDGAPTQKRGRGGNEENHPHSVEVRSVVEVTAPLHKLVE